MVSSIQLCHVLFANSWMVVSGTQATFLQLCAHSQLYLPGSGKICIIVDVNKHFFLQVLGQPIPEAHVGILLAYVVHVYVVMVIILHHMYTQCHNALLYCLLSFIVHQ